VPFNMLIMIMSFLPLMVGLLITVMLSIMVLVVLAPYWTKTAGQFQVLLQYQHLTAHSYQIANE
jgi:hypothetical protein